MDSKVIQTILESLKNEVTEAFNESKWLPFATAIAVLSSKIGPIPTIPYIHVPFILLCLVLNLGRHWTIDKISACFLFYLPLNVIIASPDPVFQSWTREAFFILVFTLVSPLFVSEYLRDIRRRMLKGIMLIITIIGLGSFFCYFLGINYMTNQANGGEITNFQGSAGGFGGLTIQSIALGIYSGMAAMYIFHRALEQEEKRLLYWILLGILLLTVLFSASRSALMSTMAGLLIMLYQKQKQNGTFIKTLLAIVVGAMITFPLWEGAAEGLIKKQESNKKIEGKYGSRSQKWEARMAEFAGSPVFGVGFSAIDPNGNDEYDKKTGTIEPGSSWLAILSMTGMIGLILFLFIALRPVLYLNDNPTPYNSLLLGLTTFFLVNMITEGYIYAGGNATCFVAWLIFGCAFDQMNSGEDYEDEEDEKKELAL